MDQRGTDIVTDGGYGAAATPASERGALIGPVSMIVTMMRLLQLHAAVVEAVPTSS